MNAHSKAIGPLMLALKQVLAKNRNVHVLHYGDAFSALWRDGLQPAKAIGDGKNIDWNSRETVLILVGVHAPALQDTPDCLKGINFADHLTALSWAAAWRVRHPKASARIAIMGFDGGQLTGPSAPVLASLMQGRNPDGSTLTPGVTFFHCPELTSLLKWVASNERREASNSTLKLLQSTIWNGLAADPNSHHSISNVIGAYLLTKATNNTVKEGKVSATNDALALYAPLQMLLGITTGSDGSEGSWFDLGRNKEVITRVELFDDMAELWRPFLASALGIKLRQVDVRGRPDGDFNWHALIDFLSDENGKPVIRRLIPTGDSMEKAALFLDLRLFSARSTSEEVGFLKLLLKLAKQLPSRNARKLNLPWPGFSEAELRSIEDALDTQDQPSEGYHLALTLLPRLIAIADPTLPIVLFSSTRQRTIVEALLPYGNVITSFHKPVLATLSDFNAGVSEDLRGAFRRAMFRAVKIAHARAACNRLARQYKSVTAPAVKPDHVKHLCGKPRLIEMFLDESETGDHGTICVGGIALIRDLDGRGAPTPSDKSIWAALEKGDQLWGHCDLTPQTVWPSRKSYLPKGSGLDFTTTGDGIALVKELVATMNGILAGHGAIYPFAIIQQKSSTYTWFHTATPLQDAEGVFDITGQKLGLLCLEAILGCFDPCQHALHNPETRVAIDFPTRQVTAKTQRDLRESFGVTQNHLDSSTVWGFLNELVGRKDATDLLVGRVTRARAVQLQDFSNYRNRKGGVLLPKQIHYLADWITHIALYHRDLLKKDSPEFLAFFEKGLVGHLDQEPGHAALLDARRARRSGRNVDAVLSAASVVKTPAQAWIPGVQSLSDCLGDGAESWFGELRCNTLSELFERGQAFQDGQ
jgi:hypothetical protein